MQTIKKNSLVLLLVLASVFLVTSCGSRDEDSVQETNAVGGLFPTTPATALPTLSTPTPVDTSTPAAEPTFTLTPPPTLTHTPAPEPTATDTPAPPTQDPNCFKAAYVADVTIPDDTWLEPGQEFVKTWRVRNNGTCPWPSDTRLVFDSGDSLSAPTSVSVGILDVGLATDVSVRMAAPTTDGRYRGVWRFHDQDNRSFGTYLTVVIRVGTPTPTSSPQPTDTPGPEASPTSPSEPSPTSPPPPPPPIVGLRNGNFEADWAEESSHRVLVLPIGGSPYHSEVGNIFTPPAWTVWFQHQEGVWAQPEGRDAWDRNPDRMRSGAKGYILFTFHKSHDAGLYQQVSVAPGTRLRFSAWVHAWSNHADPNRPGDFPHPDDAQWSEGAGYDHVAWPEGSQPPTGDPQNDARTNFTFWVGIDPTGGINPFAGSVVWSQGWHIYNGFVQEVAVDAVAQANTVTVFTRARAKWPFKHNDAYWDDAQLFGAQ